MRFFRRNRSDPTSALGRWRLVVNRFYVEAADCREALRDLQGQSRSGTGRGDLVSRLLAERSRMIEACEELRAGIQRLSRSTGDLIDAHEPEARTGLRAFLRRAAGHIGQRSRRTHNG